MSWLSRDIDDLLKKDITKDERKNLKYIRTYIDKYITSINERIDEDSCKRIKRKVFNYKPKLEALNSNKHQRVSLIEDDFLDMAYVTVEKFCLNCPGTEKDCSLRNCLTNALVPELNLPEENRPCGYMFTKAELGLE